jgi:Transglycosylase SLT domain
MHYWPNGKLALCKGQGNHPSRLVTLAAALTALSLIPGVAQAANRICDAAATKAAQQFDIPTDVMLAITRVETGRSTDAGLEPWPWTVNIEGKGLWFKSKATAMSYVFKAFKDGKRSFDVGCFQVNYRWHAKAFSSIDDMFDPTLNSEYAAKFLTKLFNEHGSWTKAVGAYHSRTDSLSAIYLSKYEQVRQQLNTTPAQPQSDMRVAQGGSILLRNAAPLIGAGQSTHASLVPLTQTNGRPSLFRMK